MKICKKKCKYCLFTKNRIVSPQRKEEIVSNCLSNQTHFICHSSQKDDEIVCSGFYKQYGHHSQLIRIMGRINALKFVTVDSSKWMTPYRLHETTNE